MTLSIDAVTVARPDDDPLVECGDEEDADTYVVSFGSRSLAVVLSTEQLNALVSHALDSKLGDRDEYDRRPTEEEADAARREIKSMWPFADLIDREFKAKLGLDDDERPIR